MTAKLFHLAKKHNEKGKMQEYIFPFPRVIMCVVVFCSSVFAVCPIVEYIFTAVKIVLLRRIEFVEWEFDALKQVTGIVVGSGYAFLLRDAEIIRRHQQLYVPLQLNNGEQAHGGEHAFVATWGNELIVEAAAYEIGDTTDVVTIRTATAIRLY